MSKYIKKGENAMGYVDIKLQHKANDPSTMQVITENEIQIKVINDSYDLHDNALPKNRNNSLYFMNLFIRVTLRLQE